MVLVPHAVKAEGVVEVNWWLLAAAALVGGFIMGLSGALDPMEKELLVDRKRRTAYGPLLPYLVVTGVVSPLLGFVAYLVAASQEGRYSRSVLSLFGETGLIGAALTVVAPEAALSIWTLGLSISFLLLVSGWAAACPLVRGESVE